MKIRLRWRHVCSFSRNEVLNSLTQKNYTKFTAQVCNLILRQLRFSQNWYCWTDFAMSEWVLFVPYCPLMTHEKNPQLFSNKTELWYLKFSECCAGTWNYEGIMYYELWIPVNFKGWKTITMRNQPKINISLIELIYSTKVLPSASCFWFKKQWLFSE